jgi:hypothetical protein
LGEFALIKSSVVVRNAALGISTEFSAVIQGNTVSNNGTVGIQTLRSTVVGNAINLNGSWGLTGGTTTGYAANTLMCLTTVRRAACCLSTRMPAARPAPDTQSR